MSPIKKNTRKITKIMSLNSEECSIESSCEHKKTC